MKLTDMNKKPTLEDLNANLYERFNIKVDLDEYSYNQLLEMARKLQTKINKLVESNNFDYVQNDDYQKNSLFLEILESEIATRRTIIEGAEDKAELVMASKDMVDRVTGWMEDTAEMQSESMLELADAIRDELGADTSQQFQDTVKPGLESLYAAMEQTRQGLIAGVGLLTGEGGPVAPMGDVEGPPAPTGDEELGGDMDLDVDAGGDLEAPGDDDFGASAAAAGGEEPADRTRRESVDLSRRLGMIMSEGYSKKKRKSRKKKAYEQASPGGVTDKGKKTPYISNGMVHEWDPTSRMFKPTRRATQQDIEQYGSDDSRVFEKKAMKPRSKKRY